MRFLLHDGTNCSLMDAYDLLISARAVNHLFPSSPESVLTKTRSEPKLCWYVCPSVDLWVSCPLLIGPSRLGSVDLHLFDGVSSVNELILAPRVDPQRAYPEKIKRQTELQLITNIQHQNLLKYF